ncbi:hypothetical protein OG890_09425 [Streptomyces anulatus]|uniref:hypothetical protein n=2 Tax=Streptomyces anulatus TaxID=1892 RepID=UPI0022570C3C|nr:hypothetical protein [Streptomyces anulatus]MCX4484170.1 hypothetical protein [Streptomyces anulatus]WSU73127.1 hypothetical protein OG499_09240 [Streptomyces anulatus]
MSDSVSRQVSPGMEFFTDFVVTGAVGGADATSTPAEVTGLLGDGFMESLTGPGQLLRCYDLVELAWQRDAAGEPWQGLYVTVQAHRLDAPLSVDGLSAALDRIGFPLVEVAPDGVGCRRLVRADSRVGVLADEATGQVLQMTAPAWFAPGPRGEPAPWPRNTGRDRVRHLAGLGVPEREAWARRRQPEESGEAARWWWSLWVACGQHIPAEGERSAGLDRSAWQEAALWLLGKCETAGVLDRAEAVCEIARYGLLAPDAAVRACLEAIPVSRADVATRETTPYTEEHLVAVNASRAAKRLSLAAGPLLPRVRDPELRAEVRAWLDLRPRLM